MNASEAVEASSASADEPEIAALIPMVRRIIGARVSNQAVADDLVQETLAKVLGAAHRVEPGMIEPYAIVTARNLVASMWKEQERHRRNEHRVVDLLPVQPLDEDLLKREEQIAVSSALARLSERERRTLLAHEVAGQVTRSLGVELGMSAGAVAAQLNRGRARLRASTSWRSMERRRPVTAADQFCSPSPSVTGVASGSWIQRGTCSSAPSAPP